MKRILPALITTAVLLVAAGGCKKEKTKLTPVPFLTGRTWAADTLLVTPPRTYAQLTTSEQQVYNQALGWFRLATVRFNEEGTVTCGGDYDLGYKTWKLSNPDIQVTNYFNNLQVLRNWTADNTRLTYVVQYNNSFDVTLVYK